MTPFFSVVSTMSSPSRRNQTGVTWGLPSARTVDSLPVRVPCVTNARHCSSVIFRMRVPSMCVWINWWVSEAEFGLGHRGF